MKRGTETSPIYILQQSQRSRDDPVMRALVSHQCGPGSIPGLGIICGLSFLLVFVFAPRGFSPGIPVSPSSKTDISKFPFDLNYCQAFGSAGEIAQAAI